MAVFTPTVRIIVNGEPVDASTTNGPISDLTQRTDWLYQQLQQLTVGRQILLAAQVLEAGLLPGMPVYYDDATSVFRAARATVDTNNLNLAAASSYWQGILLTLSGTVGSIVLVGEMELTPLEWSAVFEDTAFTPGDIYLSDVTPGRITLASGTTGVYIGNLRADGTMLVRPGGTDSFLEHVHYQRTLAGTPAGTVVDPVFNAPQVITAPNIALTGWLPANATYFPGFLVGVQIPTGAVYGYNIQQLSEASLREIFPVVPSDNSQFSQGGLILSDTRVITNNFGIWWMSSAYGDAPWPVDYSVSMTAPEITLWTTRLVAQEDLLSTLTNSVINTLAAGAIDPLAVAGIFSGNQADLQVTGTEGDLATGFKGDVTLTNLGVTAIRGGRGLAFAGTGGSVISGVKGLVDGSIDLELASDHLFTNLTVVGEKLVPVTTNGVSFGTPINLYGHRLGATVATDYIDFVVTGGVDLEAATDYYVIPVVIGAVNSLAGVVVARQVAIEFYRFANGAPASSTGLQLATNFNINTGTPGTVQNVVVGPFPAAVIQQNQTVIVRLKNSAGGSPLTPDTLRVISLRYRLQKV